MKSPLGTREIGALRTRARIAAHVVWDALVDPPARAPTEVPWRAEAITPEWITAVMARGAPGAPALGVEVSGGHAGSSVRRQLRVRWNEAGVAAGLASEPFAKTTPTLLTRLSSGMAAAGEGRFFRELRGELSLEAPVLVHSAHDRASGRSIHLFEDLGATRGARFCDWRTPISRARRGEPRVKEGGMEDEAVREVALEQWGRALLEELLFRAAAAVSETPGSGGCVEVGLTFRLTPRGAEDALEIRTQRSAQAPLVTRLVRPF